VPKGSLEGESEGKVDVVLKMREEAKECERIAILEREQAKVDRMIADEERRRQDIAKRLQLEIRRLDSMRRV
jgi:hypothetical protein